MVARSVAAVVLIIAAFLCWQAAQIASGLAETHERLATFAFTEVEAQRAEWLTSLTSAMDADAPLHHAVANYWRRQYGAFDGQDARLLLLTANAGFRAGEREASGRPIPVERLEQILQGYVAALKQGGFNRDAAYNYEYVARLRDRAGRAKLPAPASPATIHGREGVHPPPTRGEDFEIHTPMDYGDREAQPEQTPGRKLPKKG